MRRHYNRFRYYDPAGNRDDDPSSGAPWAYDGNNRIASSPTPGGGADTTYAFDDEGNLTTRTTPAGTETFSWDGINRLSTFSKSGTSASYLYDPFGRRIKKTVNGTETFYLWDGDRLLAESGSSHQAAVSPTASSPSGAVGFPERASPNCSQGRLAPTLTFELWVAAHDKTAKRTATTGSERTRIVTS
jgi:YD repeat-containing protein